MDLSALPDELPVWAVVTVVLIGALGTFSKTVAQIKGPLGAAARWWESRQIRAVEKKKDFYDNLDVVVDKRTASIRSDLAELQKQVGELRDELSREREARRKEREQLVSDHAREISQVRERERLQHRYTVEVTRAFRELEIWAADHGLELPPPPFRTFPEWLSDREARATARNPPTSPEEV